MTLLMQKQRLYENEWNLPLCIKQYNLEYSISTWYEIFVSSGTRQKYRRGLLKKNKDLQIASLIAV